MDALASCVRKYKDWPLLDAMPDGWVLDKTAGAPLSGYSFVTNGKSVINGQKRALLKVSSSERQTGLNENKITVCLETINKKTESNNNQVIDAQYVRTVNELAREKFKQRILNDILVDLMICEIEGWCKAEYIKELKELISSLGRKELIHA